MMHIGYCDCGCSQQLSCHERDDAAAKDGVGVVGEEASVTSAASRAYHTHDMSPYRTSEAMPPDSTHGSERKTVGESFLS